MQTLSKTAVAFVAAVLASSILSSLFSTQFVIAGLQGVGAEIDATTRLLMSIKDLAILKTLGLVTAICFIVGFLVAKTCSRYIGGNPILWYTLAGGSALVCTLLIMSWQLQLAPVAGARTNFGLISQGIAGAVGGFVFAKLSQTKVH